MHLTNLILHHFAQLWNIYFGNQNVIQHYVSFFGRILSADTDTLIAILP